MKSIVVPNSIIFNEVRQNIQKGHQVTITVKGVSMLPLIVGGRDTVTLSAPTKIKRFDIVLAEIAPDIYVLHRVVSIENETYILMGDGNLKGTEKCNYHNIIACAKYIKRDGHTINTEGILQKTYSWIWFHLKPLRRYLLGIYRRL